MDSAGRRFRIRRVWWMRPLLTVLGGTSSRSFVELDGDTVRLRFGPLFVADLPRSAIVQAQRTRWPWYGGLGWRLGAGKTVALTGALAGTVELVLDAPRRVRFCLLPLSCRRIVVSLEEPEALLAALRS